MILVPSDQPPAFGTPDMRAQFGLDPTMLALNGGGWGSTPLAVTNARAAILARIEACPDKFYKITCHGELDAALEPIARLLGLDGIDNLVFTANTTTAVNSVLRSLKIYLRTIGVSPDERCKILYFSTGFVPVINAIKHTAKHDGFGTVVVDCDYPISEADLLQKTDDILSSNHAAGNRVVLAIYDGITSMPGVITPYKLLTRLFQRHGVITCVDGAHMVGQVHVSLSEPEFQPDFFVTLLHKWLHVPRGCAVFFVHQRFQATIGHPVVADVRPGDWRHGFHGAGTTDMSRYLSVPSALAFRAWIGGEAAIMAYNHELAVKGGRVVAKILESRVMQGPGTLEEETHGDALYGAMVNVEVPMGAKAVVEASEGADAFLAGLGNVLLEKCNAACNVFKHGETWWIRLCAREYLNEQDFRRMGELLYDALNKGIWNDKRYLKVSVEPQIDPLTLGRGRARVASGNANFSASSDASISRLSNPFSSAEAAVPRRIRSAKQCRKIGSGLLIPRRTIKNQDLSTKFSDTHFAALQTIFNLAILQSNNRVSCHEWSLTALDQIIPGNRTISGGNYGLEIETYFVPTKT
ncbi:pyridoxal phosphate-dependent transferase [Chytriomyces sp. MP71]|nr:pyridoxal phosphate-dependent transferase [Chytriomyces sp. MP71]